MGGLPGNEQMPYTLVPRPAPHPTPLKSQHSHALLRSARSHPTLAYGPSPSPGDAVFRPAARLLCAAARAALGPGVAALLSVCLTLSSAAPTPPTHARTGQLVSSSACAGAGAGAGAGGAGSTGAAPASDIIIVRDVVEWRDLWIYQSPSPLLVSFSPSLVFVLRTYGQFTEARATSHMHSHMHWRHALEVWRCLLPALSLTIQQRTVCIY